MRLTHGLSRRFWFCHYQQNPDLTEMGRLHADLAISVKSGFWAISIGAGLSGLVLSAWLKLPIITAWSAPGTALLLTLFFLVVGMEIRREIHDGPCRLTSRTHRFPSCRSQVVEGRFRQYGTAGVTGTKKQDIHVVAFIGVADRGGNSSLAQFEAATVSTHLAGLPVQHSSVRYAIRSNINGMSVALAVPLNALKRLLPRTAPRNCYPPCQPHHHNSGNRVAMPDNHSAGQMPTTP
ncbi:benzoate membrane transport protein, partial [Alcaligenes faecalis subsp. faecalis NCIB 8687]